MYRKFFQFALVLGLLSVSAPAQAITIRADVPDSAYQAFGANPMFDSVGAVYMQDATNSLWTAGSGVLIAPDWVLTAGHNISGMGVQGGGISAVNFYLGTNIFQSYTLSAADAWYPYPGYSYDPSSTQGRGSDIGLIHLSQPLVDVAPAVLFNGEDQVGTNVYLAGFGQPAVAGGTLGARDGIKRAAENSANHIGYPLLDIENQYWTAHFDNPLFGLSFPLEGGGTPGDSGGGWFANIGGSTQLVGISTFVRGDYLNYGYETGAIRVSQYGDWINETTSSVPEPSTLVIFATGSLALLPRLLRRRKAQKIA